MFAAATEPYHPVLSSWGLAMRGRFGARRDPTSGDVLDLTALVDGADRIVVVDTETTGVYTSDRVIEVAVVTLDLTGSVVDEWDSLIDPGRDVGPTWLHGITASMLSTAPRFDDVSGALAMRLHGAAIAGHNVPFDTRMLSAEYERINVDVEFEPGLDTLSLTRCKLGVACTQHGVSLDNGHRALDDARATAALLKCLAAGFAPPARPSMIAAPAGSQDARCPRIPGAFEVQGAPSWLAGLAATLEHSGADEDLIHYIELLDVAMADLHLDEDERAALAQLATDLRLDERQVARAHRRWVDDLLRAACADGVVNADEYDALCRAATVLNMEPSYIDGRTSAFRTAATTVSLTAGRVCFTGAPVDADGFPIVRGRLEAHARRIGMEPVDNVTQRRCDLLVAADPSSQSGKAKKARQFGIPIIGALEFLDSSAGTQLEGRATAVADRQTSTCEECGRAWTRPKTRGRSPRSCPDCEESTATHRSTPRDPRVSSSASSSGANAPPEIETLTCHACGSTFERARTRGRKPTRCDPCRAQS